MTKEAFDFPARAFVRALSTAVPLLSTNNPPPLASLPETVLLAKDQMRLNACLTER